MCMSVNVHVCLVPEEAEKGVDSPGTRVIDGCGRQRQEDLREFMVRPCLKAKQTHTQT